MGHHRPNKCTVVKDPTACKNIVFQAKLCFNCLNTHCVSDCNSRNRCRGCHKKHHTSLCNETNKDATKNTGKNHLPNNDAPNITTQVQNAKTNSPVDKTPDRVHTSLSVNDYYGRQTLLKTAINMIATQNKIATAHILFDEGAQRSFITQSLADELELMPEVSETLNLSVFGGSSTSIKQVDMATINLNTEDGEKIPIQVLIIPTIAVPQKSFPTAEIQNLPYLNGLKLAHPMTTDDHFHISLLDWRGPLLGRCRR